MYQNATWYGGIGLSPGCIALDGDPAALLPQKRGTTAPPLFGSCLLWPNGRTRPSQQLLYALVQNDYSTDGVFTARRHASAVLGVVILSVCLSVTRVLCD